MNADLNKNAPEVPRLIEWAFLCADVTARDDGGWDITNLNTRFNLFPAFHLFVVCHVVENFSRGGIYDSHAAMLNLPGAYGTFRFGYIIKTNFQEEIEVNSLEPPVSTEYFVMPLGETLIEPGNYTVEIFADGALQHSLELFLR